MEIVICILAFAALCSLLPAEGETPAAAPPVHGLRERIEILRRLGLHRG